jgi:integrase
MKPKTVRHIAGLISSAYSRAIRWGLATSNPVTNSERPRAQKQEAKTLSTQQQNLVFASASSPWWLRGFLQVDAVLGCRRGELLALRWGDIVDGRAVIARSLSQTREGGLKFKATKTEKPRTLKLLEPAPTALAAHRIKQDELRTQFGDTYQDGDLIFCDVGGSPLKPDSVSAEVSLLFRRLKIPAGTSLHSLRHTNASEMLDAKVPVAVVSKWLGHSSIRTTLDIYGHMIHGADDDAADTLEEYRRRKAAAEAEKETVSDAPKVAK